jgi:hypothetical protein
MEIKLICKYCETAFFGRSDKKFCSTTCKNRHNYFLRKETKDITKIIDGILHRNRIILFTLMENEKNKKIKIDRIVLEKMNFNFNYFTGIYRNSQNKLYHYVYDFARMEFSTQEILIVKQSKI